MKNKKLFAILTLVCFMLTLMPVAAFAAAPTANPIYANVTDDCEVITVGGTSTDVISMTLSGNTQATAEQLVGDYYVFAMSNGNVAKALGFADAKAKADADGIVTVTADPTNLASGAYDIYVIDANTAAANIVSRVTQGTLTRNEAAKLLQDASNVVMLSKAITVKAASSDYTLEIAKATPADKFTPAEDGDNAKVELDANSGYDKVTVYAKLTDSNSKNLYGQKLEVSTNSSAITVDKDTIETDAAGLAKFVVSASIAGNFKVYVEYGTKADCVLDVKVNGLDPANVTLAKTQDGPVALDSALGDTAIRFTFTDGNGNSASPENHYKVAVVSKPTGSKVVASDIELKSTSTGYKLTGPTLDAEGTYEFRVILDNGRYATASVEVKAFQKPVALKVDYDRETVELDSIVAAPEVVYVDANGVESKKNITNDVTLTGSGYAVKYFNEDGSFVVKADEKYVGSKIKVVAVSSKYNLLTNVELAVANEAAAVKYADTKADVAVNNTLVANIVDVDGNKVGLGDWTGEDGNVVYGIDNIQYVVLSKPENAKVAISTKPDSINTKKGEFKVSFTASEIGEYQIQTIVKYEQKENQATDGNKVVVKYYTGTETITVGNTGFNDIVVMSIGSNEIVVNADKVAIDAAPIVQNNRTYVPFRALAEAFGAKVDFAEDTQAVTAELKGTTVVMTIGSATYTINGVEKTMDVAPFIAGDRTMIPVRFAAEAFGITVTPTYDEKGATADVLFAK